MSFPPTDPDAFVLAESIPPGQLVGHRIWVQGFGPGVVLKFEKAWVGFGTSTHTIRFQGGVEEKVKLRRHGNGKTPFVLIPSDESNAMARPVKTVFRYIVEDGSDSGSEPVTPSDAAPAQDILTEIDASQATHPMDVAPGSLVEHLEGQAWNMCARIADPQNAYSSSALSESLSESPCMGFSLTPPERQRLQMQDDIYFTKTTPLGPPSGPMDIPENDEDDDGIRRVEHTLSESGTIFTPGEHKWICAGSPSARGDFLAMIQHGGPPEHAANTSACV
jgi:hypothetical protein